MNNEEAERRLRWINECERDLKTWKRHIDNGWLIGVVWIVAIVVSFSIPSRASSAISLFVSFALTFNVARTIRAERMYWQRRSSKPGDPPAHDRKTGTWT